MQQQTQPGPSTPTQSTPQKSNSVPKPPSLDSPEITHCSEVTTIMKKLDGLSEADVMANVVPVIEGLDSQSVIEDLVQALSEKALYDPGFALIAAKLSQILWDNESIHTFVRNPLLGRTQALYNKRKELLKEKKYHGLCVYLSELFRILRIRQRPLRPMGLPVLECLKGLIEHSGGGSPSVEDVTYFHQEMSGIGSILMECLQQLDGDAQKLKDKLEEVINCARQLVISPLTLAPQVRCRLVQVIEMHASKWAQNDDLTTLYDTLLKDLSTTSPPT